jgi:hypothetical protein
MEQGPTMATNRGSFPLRMLQKSARPWVMVSVASFETGISVRISLGEMSFLKLFIRVLSVFCEVMEFCL